MGCSGSSSAGGAQGAEIVEAHGSKEGRAVGSTEASTSNKEAAKKAAKAENSDYHQKLQFLSQVQLFKRLPKEELPVLAASCGMAEFQPNETVIKQGQPGAEFYVIKSGEAGVSVGKGGGSVPMRVATLKAGDYFGENALLRKEPRCATVTADTHLVTYRVTRDEFQGLGLQDHLYFVNRKAVGGGCQRAIATKPPAAKTQAEAQLIADALRANHNLQTLALTDESIDAIVKLAWKETFPPRKEVITQGDICADYFYIVQEGSFEVLLTADATAAEQESDQAAAVPELGSSAAGDGARGAPAPKTEMLAVLGPGGSFGEMALLCLMPRAATVVAREASVVWVIDRNNFKSVLMKVSDDKLDDFVRHLDRVRILDSLLVEEKKAIAKAMIEMEFQKDEVILQQGKAGSTFYVLLDGEVSVIKDGREEVRLSASAAAGGAQFFGERALLNNEPRAATVKVCSETAKAFVLDRGSFDLLLGPLGDIIKKSEQVKKGARPSAVLGNSRKITRRDNAEAPRILRSNLTRVGLLGTGGFGAVELWVHADTGAGYAMKGISKGFVVQTGMQESVMNEKNIGMMTNSPFIIKLHETYNGPQCLYFLMEAALGGDLYSTYHRKSFFGSEQHTRYYSACVVLGLQHMHERWIIYRDLKPENLLLDEKGHLKITDMGLAKFVIGKTYTTCGTPDYFAPELITLDGHTRAVDWWTLGVLLFELTAGSPPFEATYPMQTYSKVMRGIKKVTFPEQCQGDIADLIKALLKKRSSERLPMRPGGMRNLKEHPFYASFDWNALPSLEVEAPYVPKVRNNKDLSNFSTRKAAMPRHVDYVDDGSGWDKDFATA